MAHHEYTEERMDKLHNRARDNLRLSVVPVEMQRLENTGQHILEEFSVVETKTDLFKDSLSDLKSCLLHPHLCGQQMLRDL